MLVIRLYVIVARSLHMNAFVFVVVQVLRVNEEGLRKAEEATKKLGHPVR